MSFFDLRFSSKKGKMWEGMTPLHLNLNSIAADLSWHNALYKSNKLPLGVRVAFMSFRIIQLVAYYIGWQKGQKYDD